MKSKIKGCIHHKSKVLKMEDGGAVTPAVMPPASGGGKMGPLVDRMKSFLNMRPNLAANARSGMNNGPFFKPGGKTRFPESLANRQGTQDRSWEGKTPKGPTMNNKNYA